MKIFSFYFIKVCLLFKENDACLKEMEKILKADIRSSIEIINEIKKLPKTKKTKPDRIIRK